MLVFIISSAYFRLEIEVVDGNFIEIKDMLKD
jgi:hypothetical protein